MHLLVHSELLLEYLLCAYSVLDAEDRSMKRTKFPFYGAYILLWREKISKIKN